MWPMMCFRNISLDFGSRKLDLKSSPFVHNRTGRVVGEGTCWKNISLGEHGGGSGEVKNNNIIRAPI